MRWQRGDPRFAEAVEALDPAEIDDVILDALSRKASKA